MSKNAFQTPKNAFYAQSGGVTAVINTTAAAVIETARKYPDHIATVYAGQNGILGALYEELIDTATFTDKSIAALKATPAGAFGSCRHKLGNFEDKPDDYRRLIEIFAAHNIGYFFYNGGGDSQDTAYKISMASEALGYPVICVGIPKTIDNDLPFTDNCPGFGSVAKYVAISIREAAFDVASMASNSTKVFVLEVMGRHTGWIAAATGLAQENEGDAPHVILFPEIVFDEAAFLKKVKTTVERYGYCALVVSEGIKNKEGQFVSEAGTRDAFGHAQLGGVAPVIADKIKQALGYKYHFAIADYLQRSARHIASAVDAEQAYALGKAAVELAVAGKNAVMPVITRTEDVPYTWRIDSVPLKDVANQEKTLPRHFVTQDGFGITEACRQYLRPLIQGENYPPYVNGLPNYTRFKFEIIPKKLAAYKKV